MNLNDPDFLDTVEFRQIAALSEAEQRELLVSEDPRVRVWAAWGLGLRLDAHFAPEARARVAVEPVPGVRRHLLVMLAGFGEVDIVAALARHDADELVRSTAARYVGELAPNHPDAFAVAAQLLEDAVEGVRAAIIDGLPLEVPEVLQSRLRGAQKDPSPLVREACVRRASAADDRAALWRLGFEDHSASVRRAALVALIGRVGVRAAFDEAAPRWHRRALTDLEALRPKLAHRDVEAFLAEGSNPRRTARRDGELMPWTDE